VPQLAEASPALAVLIGVAVAVAVLLGFVALAGLQRGDVLRSRLGSARPASAEEAALAEPLVLRGLRPLAGRAVGLVRRLVSPQRLSRTGTRLALAGNPGGLGAVEFVAFKLALAVAVGAAAVMLGVAGSGGPLLKVGLPLAGAGLAFILPEFWLSRRIGRRRQQILLAVPDSLDLLTISVRAGLSFDGALAKVVEKTSGPLAEEFRKALAEIRVGRPRREALRDIVGRTEVPALTSFIGAIAQAEQLGVPISRVLQVQSEQLRIERRQRAEELANKAPIKIMFPLVGCIFPALFIVILGPAVILLLSL
jgi:tight adherence protein C